MSADFWAGYASGALGIIVGNPLDLIKVRLQAGPAPTTPTAGPSPHSFREALRGLPAPVLTYGALNALLFTSYNRSLALLAPSTSDTAGSRPPYPAHFLAGALAGLATWVISTPTELIKCRAQTGSISSSTTSSVSSWQIARQTFARSGLPGLYEGGVVTSVRDAVGYGFYFWTYEASKDVWDRAAGGGVSEELRNSGGLLHHEAVKILLCGGIAGVATWASVFPLDVIKTRVQTQMHSEVVAPIAPTAASSANVGMARETVPLMSSLSAQSLDRRKKGAVRIAIEAYRNEGMAVFFRGMTVCCVRAFIVNAVQWATYEYIMRLANAP